MRMLLILALRINSRCTHPVFQRNAHQAQGARRDPLPDVLYVWIRDLHETFFKADTLRSIIQTQLKEKKHAYI